MQRILLCTLLGAALGSPAWAASVTMQDVVEVVAPDGSASVESMVLLDDGTSAAVVRSMSGPWAVMRFDAAGNETSRWFIPDAPYPFAPPAGLSVRGDGAVMFFTQLGSQFSLHAIDAMGNELPGMVFPDGELAQGVPNPVPGGFTAIFTAGGVPQLRRYSDAGALQESYVPASLPQGSVGFLGSQTTVLADGGVLAHESHQLDDGGNRTVLRRLDAQWVPQWTQDFAAIGGAPGLAGVIEGPDERRVAMFNHGGLGMHRFRLVRLSPTGSIEGQTFAPVDSATVATLSGYGHAGGFGFMGSLFYSAIAPQCHYEATLDFAGQLSESCTPLTFYPSGGDEHLVPGGIDLLRGRLIGFGSYFERISRRGADASTRLLLTVPASAGSFVTSDMTDTGTGVVLRREDSAYRMLRWEGEGAPVADALLPAADPPHVPLDAVVDGDGSFAIALRTETHNDMLRIAADGSQSRWSLPGRDHVAVQIEAAADGRYRFLLAGASARLVSLEHDGAVAWTHDVPAPDGTAARVELLPDGVALLAQVPAGMQECRVRRVAANGAGTGDSASGAAGQPVASTALANGAVFACRSDAGDAFMHVDAGLAVSPVSMQECPLAEFKLASIDEERWTAVGVASGSPDVLRFCTFDGAAFVQSHDVPFENTSQLEIEQAVVRSDAVRGEVHLALRQRRADSTRFIEHVTYDTTANAAVQHRLHDVTAGGELLDMQGPDHRGRFVYLLRGMSSGAPARIDLARPGHLARESVPVALGGGTARLGWSGAVLRYGTMEFAPFDQIVLRVGDVTTDLVFDAGFE
jgi:hypothetical protein